MKYRSAVSSYDGGWIQ